MAYVGVTVTGAWKHTRDGQTVGMRLAIAVEDDELEGLQTTQIEVPGMCWQSGMH